MRRRLSEGVDLVVGTPAKVAAYREQRLLFVSKLRYLVLDEADTLLNSKHGFLSGAQGVQPLLDALRSVRDNREDGSRGRVRSGGGEESYAIAHREKPPRAIFVGASFPAYARKWIALNFPSTIVARVERNGDNEGSAGIDIATAVVNGFSSGTGLPDKLRHFFVSAPGHPTAAKANALVDTIVSYGGHSGNSSGGSRRSAVVFTRDSKTCRELALILERAKIGARELSISVLHGDVPARERKGVLGNFMGINDAATSASTRDFRDKHMYNVLVCTDVVARGIDFPEGTLVVSYDFPSSGVEFVHRCGRAARAGREGTAVTLVTPRDRHWGRELEEAVEKFFASRGGVGRQSGGDRNRGSGRRSGRGTARAMEELQALQFFGSPASGSSKTVSKQTRRGRVKAKGGPRIMTF